MAHWIMANTSGGFRGRSSSPCKGADGKIATWPTKEAAEEQARAWTKDRSRSCGPAMIWYTYGGEIETVTAADAS